ncbi:MAG TPA: carboxypeptidase regulatory-like domain-containing protein [Thermoanaerobaculia bacterium]|nr:carboxypeptidase regulatory-like domain-containing protein [Thermoanaerobaculia bacterium]
MKASRKLLLLFVLLVAAVPLLAQEQTGGIDGRVTDGSGAVLPGVTVSASSSGSGTLTTVTEANGTFRFPRVPPGVYAVTAELMGFKPAAGRAQVVLGKFASVELTLALESVTETITVTAEAPLVDVSKSATATSISKEQIDLVPKGRDFTTVATQAPGASSEDFMLGGISIDGASGSENRFVIDGVDTTNPQDGLSGQNLITDFIDEVQVKSAGYAAEFGGAVGGVINVVTRTGSNELSGWAGGYLTDSSWGGDARPQQYESAPGNYRTFDKDDVTTLEPGFALGGPILRDRLWFYVGYSPQMVTTGRTPDGSSTTFEQEQENDFLTANIKGNAGSKFLYKGAFTDSSRVTRGQLPLEDNSTPGDADLTVDSEQPTKSYSVYADYLPSNSFFLSGRAGGWSTDTKTSGVDATSRIYFRNGVIPVPATDPRYRPTGFSTVPAASYRSTEKDQWTRDSASLDANLFVSRLGVHSLKGGVQYEKISNEVASFSENGNLYEIRWGLPDRFGVGVQGTYGSVHVRRFGTLGAAESTNVGLYLQDSWQASPSLMLNVGVRTEQEKVPNYGAKRDPSLPENAIEFDFQDKLAPRVGFAWDLFGNQQWKMYGSYGTYYDITKLEMPRGSFGADQWIAYLYPLNTLDWETLPNGCKTSTNVLSDNPCPNLGAPVSRDLRRPSDPHDAIDPDLKPMQQREIQLGLDHELGASSMVGARYVNKSLIDTIEDIGYLVFNPDGTSEEHYITGNPGKGLVGGDPAGPMPAQAEAVRDYQALELTYVRRLVDRWSLRAAYTYSQLEGNYSGLASSDEFGRTDPNVGRYFDGLVYGFDSKGDLVEGALNTDRPHALEAQFLYQMPWGTSVGVSTSWASGSPVSEVASYNGVQFFPNGRETHGRLDAVSRTDLLLTHPFSFGDRYSLEASLNVLNLFDDDTVISVANRPYRVDICDVFADCDGTNEWYFSEAVPFDFHSVMDAAGAERDPFFLRPQAWQAPRSVRVGLKFIF